ncbi:MAG: sulfotransferase [Gammaproteobacteria bacterium]|nr:sulfotransferase [Gammaproteobacteria bacterium]MDE2273781.1 sulfotransferase [Gammaproteobacteria bacterium]
MNPALTQSQVTHIHRLMREAAEAYNRADIATAVNGCQRVLSLHAEFAQAWHLLGLCRWQQGQLAAAADALERAAGPQPRDAQVMHDLGSVYSDQGAWALAVHAYLKAIELRPRHAESFLNMGAAYENLGEHEQAERAYQRALALNPQLAGAAASLASLAESANRLAEAANLAGRALALDAADPVANLTQAQLDLRADRPDAAAARLRNLLEKPLRPRNRSLALARLGAMYEQRGDYAQAFAAFQGSKQALNAGEAAPGPGVYTLATVERVARYLDRLAVGPSSDPILQGEIPAFLVGFPRSGTTLLDQILSSHPRLVVLEEKENLQDLLRDFVTSDAGLEQFASTDSAALESYRNKYWARVAEALPQRDPEKLFVDKLPLNTLFMPLIARLFPAARFVFAVRDPRDVVLSCYMRAFGLNEAMRNFLTLAGTAELYAGVMQIGIRCRERLGDRVHLIRYESLVDDLEGAARDLCAFLELDWDPAMLRFQETAKKRRINTPSYHQVVQPVYASARARWRHYREYLEPVLPRLQPFVEFFGYA